METRILFATVSVIALGLMQAPAGAQEQKWSFEEIGVGIKPALAVDGDGTPHVSFLTEAIRGATFYATNKSGAWTVDEIAEGYFYGPVDIDVSPEGVPYIAYHDHEAASFNPQLGAGVVQWPENGAWQSLKIDHPGHDQWDSDIDATRRGGWHFAGIDPVQFGSNSGLEYVTNAFGGVLVEEVGSGAIPYEFGVSIEVGSPGTGGGVVGISYYGANTQDLRFAERGPGIAGPWIIETVAEAGDVGRYSDLGLDSRDEPHISYWSFETGQSGTVNYAWRNIDAEWQIEEVGRLENVEAGFTGARKITAIEVDRDNRPHIMYGDKSQIFYATRGDDGTWTNELVLAAPGNLGQLVEFALDNDGRPHLTYFEVTNPSPLQGKVFYGTTN